MIRILATLLVLTSAPLVQAANTNIRNDEALPSVRPKLNALLSQWHNVKQPPYSAVANNHTNDHDAIQAAINDACNDGRPVYIPAGSYHIGSALSLAGCRGIRIFGDGKDQTYLNGAFDGFVIDSPDTTGGCCKHIGIEHIAVVNYYRDISAGAIRMANINPGSYIRDCRVGGYTGIDIQWNTFTAEVSDCNFNPPDASGTPGTTAIYMAQAHFQNSKLAGYDVGVAMYGPGAVLDNIGVETSNVGVGVGYDRPIVFRGHISGSTLTIDKWYAGHAMNYWSQSAPYKVGFCAPCAPNTQIIAQLTNTNSEGLAWKEGTYTVTPGSQNVAAQSMLVYVNALPSSGSVINALQTERDNISLHVQMANQVTINSAILTGTVGVGIQVSSASWSAADGGTIIYNLRYPSPSWTQGVHDCSFDGFSNPRYNQGYHTQCRWAGTAVTKTRTGADPGAWVDGYATVAPLQYRCTYVDAANNVTIANSGCSHSHIDTDSYTSDFYGGGWAGKDNFLVFNSNLGATKPPPNNQKAGIRIFNSIPTAADMAMHYADLPGPGNSPNYKKEGEMYYIVDANAANIGDPVRGGGSIHGWVVWNGSAWTLMSK